MVTSVTSFGRSGVADWLVQRVSAVILLAYFLFLGFIIVSGVDYLSWKSLFDQTWMRIFSLLALLALAAHTWIGVWTVLSDYFTERLLGPKGNILRVCALVLTVITLFVYIVWGIQILWGN